MTTRTTSTNPFDDDYDCHQEEVFHDAQQQHVTPLQPQQQQRPKKRLAPLHFPSSSSSSSPLHHYYHQEYYQEEHPALQFDKYGPARKVSNEFFSPLEGVMMQMSGTLPPSPTKRSGSGSGIGGNGIGIGGSGGGGGAPLPSYAPLQPTWSPERNELWTTTMATTTMATTEQSPLLSQRGGSGGGGGGKKYTMVPSEIRTGPSTKMHDDMDEDDVSYYDDSSKSTNIHHHHHHRPRSINTIMTTTTPTAKNPILQELSGGNHHGHAQQGHGQNTQHHAHDQHPPFTSSTIDPLDAGMAFNMEYKLILLEDLGTASSWLILLLPYCAFLLSLLWESATSLRLTTAGPLGPTQQQCEGMVPMSMSGSMSGPMSGSMSMPVVLTDHSSYGCWSHVPLHRVDSTTTTNNNNNNNNNSSSNSNSNSVLLGTVFESGSISPIPILSTYLYGDAYFMNLTQETVDLVENGWIQTSVVVFQEMDGIIHGSDEEQEEWEEQQQEDTKDWSVMFYSPPQTMSMTCERDSKVSHANANANATGNSIGNSNWNWNCNCRAPRLVDVVFSMPDAAVYTGGDLRIHVYFAPTPIPPPSILKTTMTSTKASSSNSTTAITTTVSSSGLSELSYDPANRNVTQVLQELVTSSSFLLEHMSPTASHVGTAIRVTTFLVTFWFFLYWCRAMGVHKWCCRKQANVSLWWESPWILFPERCYIVILMLSLMMMQQPVLALVSIVPSLRPSTRLHIVADATVGIGAQGVLFVYLCLFHGFRFHTAAIAKKRTEHQRKMLELRRAVMYVTKAQNPTSPTEAAISQYTHDYFEEHGDVDGSASTSLLRLPNDPFADGWADFLLLKILLLLVGVISTIGTAYYRDPIGENKLDDFLNGDILRYKRVYIACISIEFATLVAWMWLILVAAFESGNKLRSEPFLGTRPVQLSFRILMAHLFLGFAVFSTSFALNIHRLIHKWQVDTSPNNESGISELSGTELAVRVLSSISQQFPYSGTTASAGSGNILFATVTVLITAFIFLPAHTLEEDDDNAQGVNSKGGLKSKLNEQRRLRRDKRLVVNLVRDTRTWRVLPLPIKQITVTTSILRDNAIQLYSDMTVDETTRGRGVISVGPYTPVFCLEIACWLNEASWQAYYSPEGIIPRDPNITAINLESLGLHLEGAVYDEATDTQAYVATNYRPQVDGDKDSVIVVAFRGSASTTNLQTDLKSAQVPLLDQLVGTGSTPFNVFPNKVDIDDGDGWIWDTPTGRDESLLQCVIPGGACLSSCIPGQPTRDPSDHFRSGSMTFEARKILQSTPIARGSFPLVHEGFQEAYIQVRQKLLEVLLPVIQRQLAKCIAKGQATNGRVPLVLPKIYCTGHSLGGSLAQLLALDLANNCELVLPLRPGQQAILESLDIESWGEGMSANELRLQPPIAVYTFGQPRVGNRTFSRLYKQRVPHTFRVVNEGDAITSLPNYLFCGGIYKHAGLEVLLDEGMTGNILVGPTVVETLFRFHKVRTSVLAHTMQRYRDGLECAFAQDELLEYFQGHNVANHSTDKKRKKRISTTQSADIPEWMTQMRTPTATSTAMYY